VQGQNLLFVGEQGPVGAPALRLRTPDHGAPPWTRNATGRIDAPVEGSMVQPTKEQKP
jgi:hypothetical protein